MWPVTTSSPQGTSCSTIWRPAATPPLSHQTLRTAPWARAKKTGRRTDNTSSSSDDKPERVWFSGSAGNNTLIRLSGGRWPIKSLWKWTLMDQIGWVESKFLFLFFLNYTVNICGEAAVYVWDWVFQFFSTFHSNLWNTTDEPVERNLTGCAEDTHSPTFTVLRTFSLCSEELCSGYYCITKIKMVNKDDRRYLYSNNSSRMIFINSSDNNKTFKRFTKIGHIAEWVSSLVLDIESLHWPPHFLSM